MKTDFLLFSEKMFWRKHCFDSKCYFNFCSRLLANLHVFSSLANRSAPVGMWYREARSVFIDCLISPLFEKDAIRMGRHGLLFPSRLTVHILSKLYVKQYSLCLWLSTTLCVLVGVCVCLYPKQLNASNPSKSGTNKAQMTRHLEECEQHPPRSALLFVCLSACLPLSAKLASVSRRSSFSFLLPFSGQSWWTPADFSPWIAVFISFSLPLSHCLPLPQSLLLNGCLAWVKGFFFSRCCWNLILRYFGTLSMNIYI